MRKIAQVMLLDPAEQISEHSYTNLALELDEHPNDLVYFVVAARKGDEDYLRKVLTK